MRQIEMSLKQLKLKGMQRSLQALEQTKRIYELSFIDGLELLLESELEERQQNRFERLIRGAKFRYQASMAELDFDPTRGLNKDLLTRLATCEFIAKGEAILITGKTGSGKSFLASALGHQACLHGYSVAYYNMHKLMAKIKIARLEGSLLKFFDKIAKTQLLIVDDFGLASLDKQQQYDLMEIIEDRHAKASTIISSQLPIACWYDVISESTIADAIMDRLVHTAYKIELKSENSLRNKKNR